MSEFIIRQGDVVLCVDASLPLVPHPLQAACKNRLKEGAEYHVSAVVWLFGEKGLHLVGLNHEPTDGWRAARFRKIDKVVAPVSEFEIEAC